jgi:hypothetical protein
MTGGGTINLRHPLMLRAADGDALLAGLFILEHKHNPVPVRRGRVRTRGEPLLLALREGGVPVFQQELPFNRSSLTRWRQRLGGRDRGAFAGEPIGGTPSN